MSADHGIPSLTEWQQWENTLLPLANQWNAETPYFINDWSIGSFISNKRVIQKQFERLGMQRPVRVLEIGCGQGESLLRIKQKHEEMIEAKQLELVGTRLQEIPVDELLPEEIQIINGVEIHALPEEWKGQWDIVLTQRVMGWAYKFGNIDRALEQIRHALCPGGLWLGFESYNACVDGWMPLRVILDAAVARTGMEQMDPMARYNLLALPVKDLYDHTGYSFYKPNGNEDSPKKALNHLLWEPR